MKRNLSLLANNKYDVLVIGGGITGACIAHDAALRGLSVALVEKHDFGACTSSASSKLLHGGVRYLAKGQFSKVRESAREQIIFQHLAPHLTNWIPFLVPTDKSSLTKGRVALKAAMLIYDICCAGLSNLIHDQGKQPPVRKFMQIEDVVQHVPILSSLPGLSGGQILYESHMHSSERMTLAFLKTAVSNDAQVANYLEVSRLILEKGMIVGAQVYDRLTDIEFPILAKCVINAAGPFVQAINSSVPELKLHQKLTGFSRGVHLVTRPIESRYALALTTKKKIEGLVSRGGRHFFIIPWRGRSLIGTTNVPLTGKLDDIRVTARDVTDFLKDINSTLPDVELELSDVCYAFTGIYPLVTREIRTDTYQGTGDYQVIDHAKHDGVAGIVTALGAKFTTARYVAEQCVDMVMVKLGGSIIQCRTKETQLVEGGILDLQKFLREHRQRFADILSSKLVDHLVGCHGREIEQLVHRGRENDLLVEITPERNTLEIEVYFAVSHEMALTLEDVVFRRTGLGTIGYPGDAAIQRCAELMGNILHWTREEQTRQVASIKPHYEYL